MAHRNEEARLRAEANFKRKERQTEEGGKAWAEHLAAAEAADANRARLRTLRLAKEAEKEPSKGRKKAASRRPPNCRA
jgi:hypothetical protein